MAENGNGKKEREEEAKRKIWRRFIYALSLVLVVWFLTPFVIGLFYTNVQNAGAFADTYGAINALFSGLAFAVLIFTMLLQKQELEYQREELITTRQELAGQKEQLAAQNKTLRQQTLESTFFSLLNLLNELVNSIALDVVLHAGGEPVRGRASFYVLYWNDLREFYRQVTQKNPGATEEVKIEDAYNLFVNRWQPHVGHYHRTIYRIIKFVKDSDIEGKKLYAGLLRAQLSSYQLTLLFYNCLNEVGRGLKPYVEEFALLKNMQPELLLHHTHKSLYDQRAFGDDEPDLPPH